MTTETRRDGPRTAEAAGELRQRLRMAGWRSDFAWSDVGSGSAAAAMHATNGVPTRRTIAYLPALRALDGGASRVWTEGDVPVPPEAGAREVMVATPNASDWESEVFEAPAETVADETVLVEAAPTDDARVGQPA